MNIYIKKDGQRKGPFSIEQVGQLIRKGECLMSDLVWREGMAEWQPIFSIEDIVEAALPQEPDKELKQVEQPSPATVSIQSVNIWIFNLIALIVIIGFCIGIGIAGYFIHTTGFTFYAVSLIFGVMGAGIPVFICHAIIQSYRKQKAVQKVDVETEALPTKINSLLKCSYCGAQYPEGTLVCPMDETPLSTDAPKSKRAGSDSWSVVKGFLSLGLFLAVLWLFFHISDSTNRVLLMRMLTIFTHEH